MTHLHDLVMNLDARGIEVFLAVPREKFRRRRHFLGPLQQFPVHVFSTSESLTRYAKRVGVHLVHTHSPNMFNHSLRTARRLRLPMVITLHGVRRWLDHYPAVFAYARRIIPVGPAQGWSVQERYPHKVTYIPNGINLSRFRPRLDGSRVHERPLRVIWFGRTSQALSEGVEALDEAIGMLKGQGRRIDARMIGRARGATVNHLEVCGWADDPVSYLQEGHVVFGHGRALREAMACGNVGFLLAHRYGGLIRPSWFAKKEHTMGALPEYAVLPKPDPEVIAADLANLDNDWSFLAKLRREARHIAEMHFDVRTMVQATMDEYAKAVR